MNIVVKCYCRTFQPAFRLAMPFMPYREPERFDSIQALPPLLERIQIRSVLLVTDRPLREAGATRPLEDLLARSGVRCAVYDGTRANPTVHNVEDAREQYLSGQCQGIIAFGGGSSMDCAKAAGARIVYPKRSVNQMKGLLRVLLPIGLELYGASVYRKLWELGRCAGVVDEAAAEQAGAVAFIAAIRDLNRRLNIPEKLPEIRREDIPAMAAHAAREANPLYPVHKLMDAAELEQFYLKAADWSEA
ncbi:MAG: iron-containing alcohol dehydrogenase [Subdoligranulum sp.]|nr:iron-containing alcohol dehydrogenase [Subdoligranulum sp.]